MKTEARKFNPKLISVIMPAYKAERTIGKSLLRAKEVLDVTRYNYEIICVDDGNTDKTRINAERVARKFGDKIKVVGYPTNLGKGHAVRYGMAQARGDIIGFIDAGFDIDPNGISMLLEHFEWYDADVVIGSKRHPASKIDYSWQRRIISTGYQILVRILFGVKVRDTQVGLKFFRREVLEAVLPRVLVKEFAFDIELLSVSYHLGFKRIFEAPVELNMKLVGSTLVSKGFIKTVLLMLKDTAAVFYRLRILHYYDTKNRKNWITPQYLTFKNSK